MCIGSIYSNDMLCCCGFFFCCYLTQGRSQTDAWKRYPVQSFSFGVLSAGNSSKSEFAVYQQKPWYVNLIAMVWVVARGLHVKFLGYSRLYLGSSGSLCRMPGKPSCAGLQLGLEAAYAPWQRLEKGEQPRGPTMVSNHEVLRMREAPQIQRHPRGFIQLLVGFCIRGHPGNPQKATIPKPELEKPFRFSTFSIWNHLYKSIQES